MRLVDLDPRWLLSDGQKAGFIFLSPSGEQHGKHWRQTCFFRPTLFDEQEKMIAAAMADQADEDGEFFDFQACESDCGWTAHGELDFATLTVTPSLDGSKGGLWHGFITDGQIVGGI
jgi:hypothetical protein